MRRSILGGAALLAFGLTGCGPDYSPNTYQSAAVQQAAKVEKGLIVGVRQVDITALGAAGTVTGAAAGGIAGAQAGESTFATAMTALGGTVVGGILGATIDRKINDTVGFEYIVRKSDGEMVSVTQKDEKPLAIGVTVLVISGPQARVVPDYTVPLEPPPPPPGVKPAAAPKPAAAAPVPPATPAPAAAAPAVVPAASAPSSESRVEVKPLAAPAPALPDEPKSESAAPAPTSTLVNPEAALEAPAAPRPAP